MTILFSLHDEDGERMFRRLANPINIWLSTGYHGLCVIVDCHIVAQEKTFRDDMLHDRPESLQDVSSVVLIECAMRLECAANVRPKQPNEAPEHSLYKKHNILIPGRAFLLSAFFSHGNVDDAQTICAHLTLERII